MKLVYNVSDRPAFSEVIVYAFQQVLAIMAATIAVPLIVGNGMSTASALFGAGVGTLVYLFFTKGKSPVFLGSSFAFIASMSTAFAGAVSMQAGYAGLLLGAIFAGVVYVIFALLVKLVGTDWISKLMPAIVIGPTVSIIGLSLASSAVSNLVVSDVTGESTQFAVLCGLFALLMTMLTSTYGSQKLKMVPFIVGILSGYLLATIFTFIGNSTGYAPLQIVNFQAFKDLVANGVNFSTFISVPEFSFVKAMQGVHEIDASYVGTVFAAYVPVAFVVLAEHIADHRNISTIIENDLLQDPGLHRTLLGDGVGSMIGALFGGCPNTTYGESVACVAISKNGSVITIVTAAIECILISFLSPFVAFISSIPSCVMGGVCMALYGFIAVSGLKMIQRADLEENRNLYVISTILISGIGGLSLTFGKITITTIACSLILGIIVNLVLSKNKNNA